MVRIRNRFPLVALSLLFLVLSVVAVAEHNLAFSVLPHALSALLEHFASPGEFLWWATLGGAFAGYPSGLTGYIVWVLGNTLIWVVVAGICLVVGKVAYRVVQHFHR